MSYRWICTSRIHRVLWYFDIWSFWCPTRSSTHKIPSRRIYTAQNHSYPIQTLQPDLGKHLHIRKGFVYLFRFRYHRYILLSAARAHELKKTPIKKLMNFHELTSMDLTYFLTLICLGQVVYLSKTIKKGPLLFSVSQI